MSSLRAYSAADEEAVRTRDLLKGWASDGVLSEAQHQLLKQETVCDLRRTNIFLRLVLFLFTLIIVGAAVGLFAVVFLSGARDQTIGTLMLISAPFSYLAMERAVSQARLYRYGIEEALAVCSVLFLCVGMKLALFTGVASSHPAAFLVPAAGAAASIWIWHRFGLLYAPLAAMTFAIFLPGSWTSSLPAQHVIVAALYAVGLLAVVAARPRHRDTYLNAEYSATEAFLWLGIYLALNLHLLSGNMLLRWLGGASGTTKSSRPFYWITWVLIWCLLPLILARGIRQKDRFVIAAGAIAATLTLITNKPYLGWPRHTWDPMLLGALLIGIALLIRRWLATGRGEVRHGFTAQRLSGIDNAKSWMNASAALGFAPGIATPGAPSGGADVPFSGGASGGGGATSDF